jgi:hypothetical protein
MSEQLQKYLKERWTKQDPWVLVMIRNIPEITEVKITTQGPVQKIRVHTKKEGYPSWSTYGYLIHWRALGLVLPIKKKVAVLNSLNEPTAVTDPEVRNLLDEFA